MSIKIAFFTASRAEFGILSSLIKTVAKSKKFRALLFVGGAHLSTKYGKTINEIKHYQLRINGFFNYIANKNSSTSLAKSMGKATIQLSNIFAKYKFDFVCILGDRYELLPIASNAILFNKPIIHIGGGQDSTGSMDHQVRNMLTKSAHLHFCSCKKYKEKIISMAESSWRVHSVGYLGIDQIKNIKNTSRNKIFNKFGLNEKFPTIIFTYNPATLEKKPIKDQLSNIFSALEEFSFQVVITSPNSDLYRDKIVSLIKSKIRRKKNYFYFNSLNFLNYQVLLKNCKFIIGNSSSGINEVPYYKIPTINVGIRQDGRLRHPSVIDADYSKKSIIKAIHKAVSNKFNKSISNMKYQLGNGNSSKKILSILSKTKINQKLLRKDLNLK